MNLKVRAVGKSQNQGVPRATHIPLQSLDGIGLTDLPKSGGTPRNPQGRHDTPEDKAGVAAMLIIAGIS